MTNAEKLLRELKQPEAKKDQSPTKILLVRLPKQEKQAFKKMCKRHNVSMEGVLIKLIKQAINGQPIGCSLFQPDNRGDSAGTVTEGSTMLDSHAESGVQACWHRDSTKTVLRSEQRQLLLAELDGLPEEQFPELLRMIRAYRESVLLKPAAESFRKGWAEALGGETSPIDEL